MSIVFSIITQKGGVGKTTTVNALAASFNKLGNRVLCVDMDPQGNLSFSTGADSNDSPTVYDAITGRVRVTSCIQHTSMTDIIPSNILLTGAELEFTGKNREFILKNILSVVDDKYDYIFIDSPPGLGFLTINALSASDYVIIPMLPDIFSLQGLVQVYETIEYVQKASNPELSIMGILINKYNKRSKLHKEALGTAQMISDNLDIPIFNTNVRNSPKLAEAHSLQTDIYSYCPKCSGVKDYDKISTEII
ncbi:ParA family protein [Porcipelethomonas sp.]|uniref:ParA family protein n=1 Tax=Porcipelethomonas sp. TaxID=2981675 RepID=UPI003EF359B4